MEILCRCKNDGIFVLKGSYLKTLLLYFFLAVIAVFVLGKPILTFVSKSRSGSIVYLLESEKEDESQKEFSSEETDLYLASSYESTHMQCYSCCSFERTFIGKYAYHHLNSPFIKGFHIPPEV